MVASEEHEHPFLWLEETRRELFEHWTSTTGHRAGATARTWACEIALGCRTCNEHLSLPCSLLREANEIGVFLQESSFTKDKWMFLRLYLILLSEFADQLQDISGLLELRLAKPPSLTSLWANNWAKHRLKFLVQHHPDLILADEYEDWSEMGKELPVLLYPCANGIELPTHIIDTNWLRSVKTDGKRPDLAMANGVHKAVIVVPPLRDFLVEVISYYRAFVDAAKVARVAVRLFESKAGCAH
jgi:hypothetical protein